MTDRASSHPIRIATRGSALALAQAESVLAQCQKAFPNHAFKLTIIKTTGDQQLHASLTGSDLPKGLFTKEIEVALLQREADLAVHSLKDLPTDLPEGLMLGAVSARADVRDVLVCRRESVENLRPSPTAHPPAGSSRSAASPIDLSALPPGAAVATSSTRRAAQLLDHRRDLRVVPIRGNVGTRLRKLAEQPEWAGTVLAAAGLGRLSYSIDPNGCLRGPGAPDDLLAGPLSLDEMLPCVGQAALGLEIRKDDRTLADLCAQLDHYQTRQCVTAERAFLTALGGGCHLAVAAYAEVRENRLRMRAVSFLRGRAVHTAGDDALEHAAELGCRLARSVEI